MANAAALVVIAVCPVGTRRVAPDYLLEGRAARHRAVQGGHGQIGAGQVGAPEVSAGEICSIELGSLEVRSVQARASEVGVSEDDAFQIAADQRGAGAWCHDLCQRWRRAGSKDSEAAVGGFDVVRHCGRIHCGAGRGGSSQWHRRATRYRSAVVSKCHSAPRRRWGDRRGIRHRLCYHHRVDGR